MTFPFGSQPGTLGGMDLTRISGSGETQYLNPYQGTYTSNRRYAQRMQRGYARGLTQTQARRNIAGYPQGVSESQLRRQRERERYGDTLPPDVTFFQFNFERRYGYSYNYWRRLRRRFIREINERAWHNPPGPRMNIENGARRDPRVFPGDIAEVKRLYDTGARDPLYPGMQTWQEWAELRLAERLTAIRAYQDDLSDFETEVLEVSSGAAYGRDKYFTRSQAWFSVMIASAPPTIELWWYH